MPTPLFVAGVARSGTTALGDVVGAHPEVVLGVERFKRRWKQIEQMSPELLERHRFFDFDDGATNLVPAVDPRWAEHYAKQAAKWDGARYVGDKMTVVRIGSLAQRFPGARFVCVVRPVAEVAASWQARATNEADAGWPARMDAELGVQGWVRNMRRLLRSLDRWAEAVTVVDYSTFFGDRSGAQLERVLAPLGLQADPELVAALDHAHRRYDALAGKTRVLAPEHQALVDAVDPALWSALSAAAAR